MPIRTFWSLTKQANRIKASNDTRHLHLLASVGSSDGVKETSEQLRTELGTPVVAIDNRRDGNATQSLRDALRG